MFLSRLTFYSRNLIKVGEAAGVIRSILTACSDYSATSGLTGGIVFNERYYLQVMEGSRDQLSRQLAVIGKDPRQTGLTVVAMREITRRDFEGWAVGYAGNAIDAEHLCLRYSALLELDPTRMTGESAEAFVRDFSALDRIYVQRSMPFESHRDPLAGVERIKVTNTLHHREPA